MARAISAAKEKSTPAPKRSKTNPPTSAKKTVTTWFIEMPEVSVAVSSSCESESVITELYLVPADRTRHRDIAVILRETAAVLSRSESYDSRRLSAERIGPWLIRVQEESHAELLRDLGNLAIDVVRVAVALNLVFLDVGDQKIVAREILADLMKISFVCLKHKEVGIDVSRHIRSL